MGLGTGLDIYALTGSFWSRGRVGWEHGGKCQSRGVWERTKGCNGSCCSAAAPPPALGAVSEQHLLCDIPFALKKVALVEFLLLFFGIASQPLLDGNLSLVTFNCIFVIFPSLFLPLRPWDWRMGLLPWPCRLAMGGGKAVEHLRVATAIPHHHSACQPSCP